MGKAKAERRLKDNEAQAFASVVQTTPRKLNLPTVTGVGGNPGLAGKTKTYVGSSGRRPEDPAN